MSSNFISAANTAKLIRKALKAAFPGQKFYVRTDTYSMGASINVYWMDGPTEKEVNAVVKIYEGSDFDGMIDLKTSVTHWMLPDGTVQIARHYGTGDNGGFIPPINNPQPHPDARLVHFMADYVFTKRDHSRALVERAAQQFHQETGWEVPEIAEQEWWVHGSPKGTSAYFKADLTQCAPGDTRPLADHYNCHLYTVSAYEKPAEADPAPTASEDGHSVTHERDWTWIKFASKPAAEVREALKALGARWSRKRSAWYICERVSAETIAAAIGS